MTIKDEDLSFGTSNSQGKERKVKIKLNPSATPKRIDWTSLDGQEMGQTTSGIYALDKGQLKICIYAFPNHPDKIIKEFKTEAGDKRLLIVLERVNPPKAEQKPDVKSQGDGKIRALLQERLTLLRDIAAQTTEAHKEKVVSRDQLLLAMKEVHTAELDLCESDAERIRVHESIVALAREIEALASERHKAQQIASVDLMRARVHRLEAEIALERAKVKAAASK